MTTKSIVPIARTDKRKLLLSLIYIIGILLFAFLTFLAQRSLSGDDANFPITIKQFDFLGWLDHRYQTWSGRLITESYFYIFGSIPIIYWRIMNILQFGILTFFLFKYYELFSIQRTNKKDYLFLIIAMAIPFGMNLGALVDGAFWVTGSMAYLWAASAGIAAFYPILYIAKNKRLPSWGYCVLGILLSFIAGVSQEQVGIVLIGSSVIITLYYFVYLKKINLFLIAQTIVTIAAFLINYLSPGSHTRLIHEANARIPDFFTVSSIQKLEYGVRWFLDAIINHMGVILVLTWVLISLLLIIKSKRNIIDSISIFFLSFASLLVISKNIASFLFDFHARWGVETFPLESYIAIIFWAFILLLTILAALSLYNHNIKSLALSAIILLTYTSAAVMTLSPTMYASGSRTMFIPSIILSLALILLADDVIEKYKKYTAIIVLIILGIPAYQYLVLVMKFITKFSVHYPW